MKTSTSTSRTLAVTAATATLALAGLAAASAPALAHSDSHTSVRLSGHGDDDPAGDDHGGHGDDDHDGGDDHGGRGHGGDDNGGTDDNSSGGGGGGTDDNSSSTGSRGGDDNGGTRGGRGGRGDDRVIRTGACSSTGTWKLKVKTDDGRLEVEGEVDTNRAGQTWAWTITDNDAVAGRGSATTGGRSGSFSVERKIPNRAGADRIVFRATRDGNVCQGAITF
ncbi:hypothetical protein SAMN04489844_3279 [Nocardioides exalbidus]|uniref:Secreted protein n=1 Tax=Nocardioides exalbidus TaxID=402596 RepID=A0A1H4WI82_9ACTN|nr:hypothetical protein [Nocardioides exalbidus]SEC93026.1 hypothetical protein SAMN04489844_3279 [Nocardioides exalbidus]